MEIVPFISVGDLIFGDQREVARKKLAGTFRTFEKDVGENPTDAFDELGLHLYYDDKGLLEFIETFLPARVSFLGIDFLGRNINDVVSEMQAAGFVATDGDVGVDFSEAGIALTVQDGTIDGIAIHRKGYYD